MSELLVNFFCVLFHSYFLLLLLLFLFVILNTQAGWDPGIVFLPKLGDSHVHYNLKVFLYTLYLRQFPEHLLGFIETQDFLH